jgi:hypothetical protein
MKKMALLKTTLAAAIALSMMMGLAGCFWGHHDHDDYRDHHDDHGDFHHDDHPDH